MLPNHPAHSAAARLRPQVQDLVSENIASLAAGAGPLDGVIPLWYGEGDLPTPAFVRDAAKQALDAGRTFYVPDMRGSTDLVGALSAIPFRVFLIWRAATRICNAAVELPTLFGHNWIISDVPGCPV